MDSMVVFFANAGPSEVDQALAPWGYLNGNVRDGEAMFFLRPYSQATQDIELDNRERARLRERLGGDARSAFLVEARHGANARFALTVVADLMSKLAVAALDDDFGHLWSHEDVQACAAMNPPEGIYAMRVWGQAVPPRGGGA